MARPKMTPGVAGDELGVTTSVAAAELPQPLLAVTETFPPAVPAVVWIMVVVDVPVQPFGRVQVYEVAPFTDAMEKVSRLPLQKLAVPLIVPGVAGADSVVTERVCAEDVPQLLPAVTETVPALAPTVAIILLVVEVPVQPFGRVQV